MNKWQIEVGGAPSAWKGHFVDAKGIIQNSIHPDRDMRAVLITRKAEEEAKRRRKRGQ